MHDFSWVELVDGQGIRSHRKRGVGASSHVAHHDPRLGLGVPFGEDGGRPVEEDKDAVRITSQDDATHAKITDPHDTDESREMSSPNPLPLAAGPLRRLNEASISNTRSR